MEEKDDFLDEYLSKGFGKVKMADLEVMIFHYIIKKDEYKGKSVQQLARILRIESSKVKSLIYKDKMMRYDLSSIKEDLAVLLTSKFHNSSLEDDGKWQFSVPDRFLHEYIVNYLQEKGHIVNYKNNREVLVLEKDGFVCLLEHVFEGEERKKIQMAKVTLKNWFDVCQKVAKGKIPGEIADAVASILEKIL